MKGRRRARQAALQALYELDMTEHPRDRVLDDRVRELYRSGAARALTRTDRRLVETMIEENAADGFVSVSVDELAGRCRAGPERVTAVAEILRGMVGHADYCRRLVDSVRRHQDSLDVVIARIAPEWPVEQMAPIDRNVLRIALWEIASGSSPTRVAINEAVELARLFSGEASRRMVNGALGAYASGGSRLELETEGE